MIELSFAFTERLISHAPDGMFRIVGTVAAFAALEALPRTMPAAYIVPLAHEAGGNDALGSVAQLQTLTLGVVLMVKHAGDASGEKATLQLQTLRDLVAKAFIGWRPPGADTFAQFIGGSLQETDAGTVVWRDDFTVQRMAVAELTY